MPTTIAITDDSRAAIAHVSSWNTYFCTVRVGRRAPTEFTFFAPNDEKALAHVARDCEARSAECGRRVKVLALSRAVLPCDPAPSDTDLDEAARAVGCFSGFSDLEERCRDGYVPTLAVTLCPGRASAERRSYVDAAQLVAKGLEQRGLHFFPRTY